MPADNEGYVLVRDRHVRRSGDDYRDAFLQMLPQGQAWPKATPDTVLYRVVEGLCKYWGFVDGRAGDLLEIESDPRKTDELLIDWERNWGLPDPCMKNPPTDEETRRILLVAKMIMLGGQSRRFFVWIASVFGYTITIREHVPYLCGVSHVGDRSGRYNPDSPEFSYWELGPPEIRYYWTVPLGFIEQQKFHTGVHVTGIDRLLHVIYPEDLLCILDRLKPAHTQIVWDLSAITPYAITTPDTAIVLTGEKLTIELEANKYTDIWTIIGGDDAAHFEIDSDPLIRLSNDTIAEDAPVGTVVGILTVINATGTPVYSLVDNAGGLFVIVGDTLQLAGELDHEIAPSHNVTVAVSGMDVAVMDKTFTITVTDVTETVGVIVLTGNTVVEQSPVATLVGTLSMQNTTGTPVYTLADSSNGKFQIAGDQLQTATVLDYDLGALYSVTVAVSGVTPPTANQSFNITVTEIPGQIVLSNATVPEDAAINTVVGTLSVQNTTGTPTFALDDSAGGLFTISGNSLQVAGPLDFETASFHFVTVSVTGVTPVTAPGTFTVTVSDVTGPPIDFALSGTTIVENSPVGTEIGTLSITVPYSGTPVWTLTDSAGGKFQIVGDKLQVAGALDFETAPSHSITVSLTGVVPI